MPAEFTTILATVLDAAETRGRDVAIHGHDVSVTYGQLMDGVAARAATLGRTSLAPGDRVLVYLEPGPDWVITVFAVQVTGCIPVLVAPGWTPADIARFGRQSGCAAILTSARALGAELAAVDSLPPLVITSAGQAEEAGDFDLRGRISAVSAQQVASINVTAGVSGAPKLVELTFAQELSGALRSANYLGLRPGDRLVSAQTLAHPLIRGAGVYAGLCAHAVNYLAPSRLTAAELDEVQPHVVVMTPALANSLLDELDQRIGHASRLGRIAIRRSLAAASKARSRRWSLIARRLRQAIGLRDVRRLVFVGAAIPAERLERYRRLGIVTTQGYGTVETAGLAIAQDPTGSGTGLGVPLAGVEQAVEPTGELRLRIDEGPWLATGDRVQPAAAGELHYRGRLVGVDASVELAELVSASVQGIGRVLSTALVATADGAVLLVSAETRSGLTEDEELRRTVLAALPEELRRRADFAGIAIRYGYPTRALGLVTYNGLPRLTELSRLAADLAASARAKLNVG